MRKPLEADLDEWERQLLRADTILVVVAYTVPGTIVKHPMAAAVVAANVATVLVDLADTEVKFSCNFIDSIDSRFLDIAIQSFYNKSIGRIG